MSNDKNYIFGPVPSRRLGYSLGIDIVPMKSCTQNCLYCQLGIDAKTTTSLSNFVDIDEVLSQLKEKLASGICADYITLSGSGEPTLHSKLGELISGIKSLCDIPVAVITNGTLLWDDRVGNNLSQADVVLPSLDAGDAKTFEEINRPHSSISFEKFTQGLIDFCHLFKGKIWLEIFLIENRNTNNAQIEKISSLIEKINPDKIQLNTASRPTVGKNIEMVSKEKLEIIASQIGRKTEVIADFSKAKLAVSSDDYSHDILELVRRHPCSASDISSSLGLSIEKASQLSKQLCADGKLILQEKSNDTFFSIPPSELK